MNGKEFHKQLLSTDAFAQYSLRSTFFVSKLRSCHLAECIQHVAQLAKMKESFEFTDLSGYGIDPEAFDRIRLAGIEPLMLFCHPRVITEQPRLLLYYRTVSLLSQKGLSTLIGGNIAKVEAGGIDTLDRQWVFEATIAINSVLSGIITTAADIAERDLSAFQFAAVGATIQGAWNNAIGTAGEEAVKTILVNNLREEIVQIVWRDGSLSDYDSQAHTTLIDRIGDVRVVRLTQGFHLVFSSEPDVALRNSKDVPVIAIEVKAGSDPAGALERLGAAMKSFENERNLNPRIKTVYVVRALTPEVQKRISQSNPVDHTFGLSELLSDNRTQQAFAGLLLRMMLD